MRGNANTPDLALFIPTLGGGGAERVFLNLANGFVERGYRVDLVLASAQGSYLSELDSRVQLVDFRLRLGKGRLALSLFPLIRYLRQRKPKVLLSALTEANIIAVLSRIFSFIPIRLFLSEHNTFSIAVKRRSFLKKLLLVFGLRILYRNVDGIIAVSDGVASDLKRIIGRAADKIKVIYNPVVTPEMIEKSEEPLEHPWFAPGEPPVILGCGRLTAQKDFETLIRAFALVRKETPCRLVILGEGEERQRLEEIIKDLGIEHDVDLPGFVSNPYKYMKRAAVFVLSSKWEGFGNVLAEAMAVGTPVVSTDCPSGPREILENGKYGPLVPVGDVKGMAEAIKLALRSSVSGSFLCERAQAFSLVDVIKQYEEYLGLRKF